MTADLLRQLDAYGDQLEARIDHVTAEEALSEQPVADGPKAARGRSAQGSRRSYRLVAGLGFAALVLIVGVGMFGGFARVEDSALISSDLDADATTTIGDRTPRTTLFVGAGGVADSEALSGRPPATQAPTTTAAPLAATTTSPPRVATTTAAPQQTVATTAPPSQTTPPSLQGRDIVFVGTIFVAVTDSAASADEVRRIAESFGGFVARSETTTREGAINTLTIRVLPSTFQTVLDRIGELGFVRSKQVTSDDVTEVVVDLQGQIVTAQVSVERLRALLAEASGLEQITRLERELLDRERELERLRGQLRTVENQVALATITVTLTESLGSPAIDLAASRYVGDDGGASCPTSGGRPDIGDDVFVCLVVTNVGDVPLVNIMITGDGVAALRSSFSVASGDLDQLDPGETALLVGSARAANPVTATFVATGTPLNDAGDRVVARNVRQERQISWNPRPVPEEPEPDTVITALQDGWDAFTDIGGRTLRVLAYTAPFVVFIGVVAWLAWWRRRRYWDRVERTLGTSSPEPAEIADTGDGTG